MFIYCSYMLVYSYQQWGRKLEGKDQNKSSDGGSWVRIGMQCDKDGGEL